MQNFRLIIYTLPVIKERHHEGKVSLRVGVIKVLQSLYPLFHAYFLLISEKSSNFARLF